MEGRQPPPKAEYTFPNNPDVYKFWGAPWGRTVIKSTLVAGGILGSLLALNTYVTWGHPSIFGSLPPTKEDVLRKRELMLHQPSLMQANHLPIETVHRVDKNLRFDDGVKFNPIPDSYTIIER